jgi:cytochrome bd-type quinol oxidase subunit 2
MTVIEENKLKIQALLEEYKTVNNELQQYTQEAMKCVPYGTILVALYLGFGLTGDANQISNLQAYAQEYIPYGFVIFVMYFLAMVYVRQGLVKYRSFIEDKVNQLFQVDVMQFSDFSQIVTEHGYFQLGKAWYSRIPTPPLFLGIILAIASILLFTTDLIRKEKIIVLISLAACAIAALYIYLIYPRLLERTYKDRLANADEQQKQSEHTTRSK